MISRSGREKPTQTHNHNTRGGLCFLFSAFFAVILSFLMRQPYLEPLPVSERKGGIFLSCIYLWVWEHRSIKEINNGEKREVSGTGDMKLMQLILDYLYYFLASCTLGIPMSTVCAKRGKLQTREAGSFILSPSLDLSVSGCVEILEEECYSFMFG